MKRIFKKAGGWIKKNVPVFAIVLYCIALTALQIHILCLIFPAFADFFNVNIAGGVRFVLAKITGILPFSLGETAVFLLLPIIVGVVLYVAVQTKKDNYSSVTRFFCGAFAVLSMFYSVFVFTLGMGYHGTPLADKLSLERNALSSDQLLEVTNWLADRVNDYSDDVQFIHESYSVMPYDFSEMNDKLCQAYEKAAEKYDFIMGYSSRIKPVMASKLLTKAGLLGMYSYYTGESNVNTDYMNFDLVYTCAHEMAHQRGISKEDEANFMAFLVCLESDDPYINYAGYLNAFLYMRNPLYAALKEEGRTAEYSKAIRRVDNRVRADFGASDKKTNENQGVIRTISDKVNDIFIKSQGDERGTQSYGLVIELTAAYYYKHIKNAG